MQYLYGGTGSSFPVPNPTFFTDLDLDPDLDPGPKIRVVGAVHFFGVGSGSWQILKPAPALAPTLSVRGKNALFVSSFSYLSILRVNASC